MVDAQLKALPRRYSAPATAGQMDHHWLEAGQIDRVTVARRNGAIGLHDLESDHAFDGREYSVLATGGEDWTRPASIEQRNLREQQRWRIARHRAPIGQRLNRVGRQIGTFNRFDVELRSKPAQHAG